MDTTVNNEHNYWVEDSDGGVGNKVGKVQTGNRNDPNDQNAPPSSQLFTVRIWPELTVQGDLTWRGKVQHVPNGAWRYFHEWHGLNTFLQSQVEEFANTIQQPDDTQPAP